MLSLLGVEEIGRLGENLQIGSLACTFLMASHICFRYWEWGGLEDFL